MKLRSNQRLHKPLFYARGFLEHHVIPDCLFRERLGKKLEALNPENQARILDRVRYYNKFDSLAPIPESAVRLSQLKPTSKTAYYYDLRQVLRYFPRTLKVATRFGDVRDVSDFPRIVKTRPIQGSNENSILLKLNSVRHFRPCTDNAPYAHKIDGIVWRGKVNKDHRQTIFQQHFGNPLCNLGKTNDLNEGENPAWKTPWMSIEEQLRYKFILSIEGNEVATNLKWIAQSNSLCFMTKPKFESWFMEGRLEASKHYVELRDDYSDLPEKMDYYLAHPDEAREIIANLNAYYAQFTNSDEELLISLLVVEKYLVSTGQREAQPRHSILPKDQP
ncbi:MAG: glycosyl transferase family 90 [Verrucomicrobia bacterium]|nr:glycosyl transferase family 90 [Verrucomicrobiota bacterium]